MRILVLPTLLRAFPAAAEDMCCHGPGQSYTATLNREKAKVVVTDERKPLAWKVEEIGGGKVSGSTADDGPGFHAFFDGARRIEFYYHGKLMKTDLRR